MMLAAVALGVGSLHAPPVALLAAAALAAVAVALARRALRAACVARCARSAAAPPCCAGPGTARATCCPSRRARACCGSARRRASCSPSACRWRPPSSSPRVLAQGSGAAMPLPGAGPAAIGAALLVALPFAAGHALDRGALASLAVVWPTALTLVGVTLSLALLAAPLRRADAAGARARRALAAPAARADRPVTSALGGARSPRPRSSSARCWAWRARGRTAPWASCSPSAPGRS